MLHFDVRRWLIKLMLTGMLPGINSVLESLSGGILGLGDGGDDSREELEEESE